MLGPFVLTLLIHKTELTIVLDSSSGAAGTHPPSRTGPFGIVHFHFLCP